MTLLVFHFDISGKDSNDIQFLNIKLRVSTDSVFHFDISGNSFNDTQPEKTSLIS